MRTWAQICSDEDEDEWSVADDEFNTDSASCLGDVVSVGAIVTTIIVVVVVGDGRGGPIVIY